MTNAIQAGSLSRTQRRQRIQALVEQIKGAEESEAPAEAINQQQETERVRRVVDGMRGFC